jgi:alkylation response protein AidB-like acyl-CoA dehydrogenase
LKDADGLIGRVRALVPLIAERAADAEQKRKPDDDVIQGLRASGVFRSFVPKRYGGYAARADSRGAGGLRNLSSQIGAGHFPIGEVVAPRTSVGARWGDVRGRMP